jgi:hypothetical protein
MTNKLTHQGIHTKGWDKRPDPAEKLRIRVRLKVRDPTGSETATLLNIVVNEKITGNES